MKTLSELETILADVETSLLRYQNEQLEGILDGLSLDTTPSVEEQSPVASQGLKQDHASSGGGLPAPAPEGYRGYSLEREGDIRFDDGSIDSAQAERMKNLRWALTGGPSAPLPATQQAKAAKAKEYSRKDRHNMGDVDNSGAMSGAS
jgi:hypothetical protein